MARTPILFSPRWWSVARIIVSEGIKYRRERWIVRCPVEGSGAIAKRGWVDLAMRCTGCGAIVENQKIMHHVIASKDARHA